MGWKIESSCGNESSKVRDRIAIYLQGQGLDLGCGPWPIAGNDGIKNNCIGIDAYGGAQVQRSLSDLALFTDESFDYVFSSHALEDFRNTEGTLHEWWRKVKVGGHFILYLPLTRRVAKEMGLANWEDFYPNMGEEGANPAHKVDFDPREVKKLMEQVGHAELIEDEIRGEGDEYSFLLVYRKLSSSALPIKTVNYRTSPKAIVVRYGAVGDMIQSTPVFRLLKEKGYYIVANCSDMGLPVLENNPYIDEVAVQRRNQVHPAKLQEYWADLAKHCDRFVNLTGSAEDSLLFPDRLIYSTMETLRQKSPKENNLDLFFAVTRQFHKIVGDKNYYDSHLEKAGLSERGLNGELYFTPAEEAYARYFREQYKDRFIILWSLAGSAYHKWYPYFQQVVQEVIAKIPDAMIVSVGEDACALMERSEGPRYLPRSGKWKWRHTLVMTKFVDLVVGPETGVLNAAGCFDTPKITLLSHSTHGNLCKYWKNDYCLAPENTPCYPCHTLHFVHPIGQKCTQCNLEHKPPTDEEVFSNYGEGMWSCPHVPVLEDKDGIGSPFPLCMAQGISPKRLFERILEVYNKHWLPKEQKELVQVVG